MDTRAQIPFFTGGLLVICGFPALFGLGYCISTFYSSGETRFLVSAAAELLVLVILIATFARSLRWLFRRGQTYPTGNYEIAVNLVSALYLVLIAITLANASTSGLLSKGGRLDYYFANDWYRRAVTLSVIPAYLATYHSLMMLASPAYRSRRFAAAMNITLLVLWSLLAGSRGAAILIIGTASLSVISQFRINIVRYGWWMVLACSVYVGIFLAFSSDPAASLLALVRRFYLSIDMSLLVTDHSVASAIGANLNDIWIETFRSLEVFGAKPSPTPLGVLVYDHAFGYAPATGANCRFASLLLLSPDRLDYLVGYPLLVLLTSYAIEICLKLVGLSWSSRVATPYFAAQSFQDVYWFATHVAPVALVLVTLLCMKVALDASVRRSTYAQ